MKKTKEASKRQELVPLPIGPIPPVPDPVPPVSPRPGPCDAIRTELEAWLTSQKDLKEFQLEPCDEGHEEEDCACGGHGGSGKPKVDLIVVIDTSSSMFWDSDGSGGPNPPVGPAAIVSAAATAAIEAALKKCPSDLRVTWLGVDTSRPGSGTMPADWAAETLFTQTHEEYLIGIGYPGPFVHDNVPSVGSTAWPHEQGADAIADLSGHFDWRPNACRSIFYISDTNLDALEHSAEDDAATLNAITQANANNVTVFAHFVAPHQVYPLTDLPLTIANYQNLCLSTGGTAQIGSVPSQGLYEKLLIDAICNSCGEKCKTVEFPDIQPCISVSWGDGDCDCLETDDYEVLYITVCNCFTNVTFANFSIAQLIVTNADGTPVAILPDGTDSVEVRPRGPICFGDIGPCVDGKPICKSREFVLYTRGAKQGKYKLKFEGICFDIVYGASTERCFEFELCYS